MPGRICSRQTSMKRKWLVSLSLKHKPCGYERVPLQVTEIRATSDTVFPRSGQRKILVLLVLTHLGLTCLAAAATWHLERTLRGGSEFTPLLSGLFGFHHGQIALLVCWGAFATQPWFVRIPRFLALTVWFLLFGLLGAYVLAGDGAKQLAEETTAYTLLLTLPSLLVLFSFRAITGCQFHAGPATPVVLQFGTKHLLLITAEAAALLALGRILIPWHSRGGEQFWAGFTGNRLGELIPLDIAATILPVVIFGSARIRSWWPYAVLALYLMVPSFILACAQANYLFSLVAPATSEEWWQAVGIEFLNILCIHASAAFTILFTFYLLRRIGYDFRRRDEGPEGRSSSKARSSAASASA